MRLAADLTFVDGRFETGRAVEVMDGRITGITPHLPVEAGPPDLERLPGKVLLPGTVNTHCHTFQSLLRGLGDDLDFVQWRDRVLYPYSSRLDRDGIYLGATFACTAMLLHGATSCVDSVDLQDEGNENAEAVIQAARDVGIRLVMARTMYDWEGAPPRYREEPRAAARRVTELIGAHSADPLVTVQP